MLCHRQLIRRTIKDVDEAERRRYRASESAEGSDALTDDYHPVKLLHYCSNNEPVLVDGSVLTLRLESGSSMSILRGQLPHLFIYLFIYLFIVCQKSSM